MAFLEWFIHESSLHSLVNNGSRDIYMILLQRFLRMMAFGMAALVMGIFLWRSGNVGTSVGTFMSLTLLGDAAISYFLTLNADRIGRRRVIMIGSFLMTLAGVVFTFSKSYYLLLFAAIIGVISPGAHEMGPFRAVQESILAQLTPLEARTDVYAWFAVTSTVGMASGLSVGGWITYIMRDYYDKDWKDPERYAPIFGVYAAIGLIKAGLTLLLTERCEADFIQDTNVGDMEHQTTAPLLHGGRRNNYRNPSKDTSTLRKVRDTLTIRMSTERRGILIRLCVLFAINSFASGMLPVTLMSWYANWRYRWFLTYRIGYTMALIWLVASIGHLFSASIARRIGLIRTMVFTHLPNAIFLALIPLAPDWKVFLILLLINAVFGSMDQAPRTAFCAAMFSRSELTAVMGTLNFVRTVAAAGGPLVTGYFHDKKMWKYTFFIAATLKILYDIGLLAMFLNTKLPEHKHGPRELTVADLDVDILLSENIRHPEEFEELGEDDEVDVTEQRYHATTGRGKYEPIERIEDAY